MTIPVTDASLSTVRPTTTGRNDGPGESLWRGAAKRLVRNPMAIIGASIMSLFVLVAILAPVLAPYEPNSRQWTALSLPTYVQGSSAAHLLGIDRWGSDELTQLIFGARQSLVIGVVSTVIGLTAGTVLGVLAGGLRGWVETLIMRFVDIMLAIPSLLLAISIAAAMGKSNLALMVAIGVAQVPIFARLLRGSMLAQSGSDYVLAGRALGLRRRTLVMSHVLPNSLGPTIVQATLNLATAIIEVAALSYLGLGNGDPGVAEWGRMIVSGQDRFEVAPWLAFYPGICIAVTALGFTLLGEALREALDPKQRR
ncbi:MAG: ABC transporter permease [Nocardioidaceae bacterium]